MCLIIHKPAGVRLPEDLLASAVEFNPHGFGLMAFRDGGRLVVKRRSRGGLRALLALFAPYADGECVVHLRYRTRGEIDLSNTQPLRVTPAIGLVHNGTMAVGRHSEARSDTWHLVADYLRPILSRRPALMYDPGFGDLLAAWAGPHNRFVLMDARLGRTRIINREAGMEVNGLWLSNSRWFDGSRFPWYRRDETPAVSGAALSFAH